MSHETGCGVSDLDVLHVGLHDFQGVLLNELANQLHTLIVGCHLGLQVTQVVCKCPRPADVLTRLGWSLEQICDAPLLQHHQIAPSESFCRLPGVQQDSVTSCMHLLCVSGISTVAFPVIIASIMLFFPSSVPGASQFLSCWSKSTLQADRITKQLAMTNKTVIR